MFGALRERLILLVGALIAFGIGPVYGQLAGNNYFLSAGLRPLEGARPAILAEEPAVVMIFTPDSDSDNATARFNTWYGQTGRAPASVYGVVVGTATSSPEVLAEVLSHRNLKFPVFMTQQDLLEGNKYRVVILQGGRAKELAGFNATVIEQDLRGETNLVRPGEPAARPTPRGPVVVEPVSPEAGAPSTRAAVTPEPERVVVPTAPPTVAASTPLPGSAPVVRTTTTTSEAAEDTVAVEETESKTPHYVNRKYGLTVRFPNSWSYRLARSGDGAVGRAPEGRSLDLRTWAAQAKEGDPEGPDAAKAFITRYLDHLSKKYQCEVVVEERFVVEDDRLEGRDYRFTYSRPITSGPRAGGRQVYRGRIQVFENDGMYKAAMADGPASEYDEGRDVVEKFMLSFRPIAEDGSAGETR